MKSDSSYLRMRRTDADATRRSLLRTISLAAALVVVLGLSFALAAEDTPPPKVEDIVAQQTQLRAQVAAKRGAFKSMHDGDRDRLMKQQDRLLQLLQGRRSIDELRTEERVEVFNHLQSVNAVVAKAEDDREVCERTRLVGSHRYQVVCMTAKEAREFKDNAKKSARTVMKCQGEVRGDGSCGKD
jgi:hypothetical protein